MIRIALLVLVVAAVPASVGADGREGAFEVWLVDQSNSLGKTYGGRRLVSG